MVDNAAMEKFEKCVKKGKPECPFLSKMKVAHKTNSSEETVKLNDIMEDAVFCKDCSSFSA